LSRCQIHQIVLHLYVLFPTISHTREVIEFSLKVCSKKPTHEVANPPEDKITIAERRVRALMDSIQPVGSFWDSPADVSADARSTITLPRAASRAENPAGVIGSPVKGKGGASASRHQTPKRTWNWQ
ncbi:hypothetical protein ANCCAN_21901, partial [Ancylostoma caninum]